MEVLLRTCATLAILATSREPFRVTGETVFYVPTLSTPDDATVPDVETIRQHDAVRLLRERAVAMVPTFELTPQNAPALAQICKDLSRTAMHPTRSKLACRARSTTGGHTA